MFNWCNKLHLCVAVAAVIVSIGNADPFDTEVLFRKGAPSVMIIHKEGRDGNMAIGTGFLISEDGYLATNFHVIEGAEKLNVKSFTGGVYPVVRIVAVDKKRDIAILKVEAKNLPQLQFGESDGVNAGMRVAVIGNPQGLESTITEGIVSAIRKVDDLGSVIQISAAISSGSSGSPVLDKECRVIGMATFKLIKGESLNFAVPSKAISNLIAEARNGASKPMKDLDDKGALLSESTIKGSKAQDEALEKDSRFAIFKQHEKNRDIFLLVTQAKVLVKEYPESALAYRMLSDAYYYTELLSDGVAAAEKAIDLDPQNARGWNDLAILFKKMCRDKDSRAAYEHGIKIAPDDAKLLIEFAGVVGSDNPEVAISALNHAKRLLLAKNGFDSESVGYGLEKDLVETYLVGGFKNEAYRAALELVRIYDDSAGIWLALADAALSTKRYEEVQPALQRAYKIDPKTEEEANVIYGYSEISRGNLQMAIKAFNKAYSINSKNSHAIDGLIDCILENRQLSQNDYFLLSRYLRELKAIDSDYGAKREQEIVVLLKSRR
jgi:tetratricopeptide (TPR) repeat protein